MDVEKDVKKLLRSIRRNGYTVDDTAKHTKVLGKDGTFLVGISKTPSDPKALIKIRADCRKAGVL
jgi:hypothetical protein